MKLLIGIPSYRRPEGLRNLLASLDAQDGVDDILVEVFVADNDPQGSQAMAVCEELAPHFRWPLSCEVVERPGISAARNAILNKARQSGASFVAMLDDDEVASTTWLRDLVRVQQSTFADVVAGPVNRRISTDSKAIHNSGIFPTLPSQEGIVPKMDATGNILLSCVSLCRLGWPQFDHSFGLTGGEDKEFFTRIRKEGVHFAWAPGAQATEDLPLERVSTWTIVRRAYRIGNSDMRIIQLHGYPVDAVVSTAKALALLSAAPICAPILLSRSWRLWILVKWSRSAGKLAALFGHRYRQYSISNGIP